MTAAPRTGIGGTTARERTTVVDLLRWTYRQQKADRMSGAGLHGLEIAADGGAWGIFGGSSSNAATIEMNGRLGCIIRSTAWQQNYSLHPDAETVINAVSALSSVNRAGAALVRRHAIADEAPHWCSTMPTPEPTYRWNVRQGREDMIEDAVAETVTLREQRRDDRGRLMWTDDGFPVDTWVRFEVLFCPLRYWPDPAFIAQCRAEYRAWHGALITLKSMLSRLQRWDVVAIGAEAEPWGRK